MGSNHLTFPTREAAERSPYTPVLERNDEPGEWVLVGSDHELGLGVPQLERRFSPQKEGGQEGRQIQGRLWEEHGEEEGWEARMEVGAGWRDPHLESLWQGGGPKWVSRHLVVPPTRESL